MTYIANAAMLWTPPSGVLPGALLFDLLPATAGWMLVSGLLVAICALLSVVTNAPRVSRGAWVRPSRSAGANGPQPQHV
jgi:hypothetical protein